MTATTIHLPAVPDVDNDAVTRFDVERLAVGELSGADKARVEAAVAADPVLKAFFDDVVASDKAFLFEHPPAKLFAAAPEPSFADKLVAFFKSPQLLSSLCAAAAVAVIVNVGEPKDPNQIKGGAPKPSVGFFVQEGEGARIGHEGDALKAGDKIQLAVKDVDKRAMVVVGVDGSGAVSVYVRESITSTAKGPNSKPRLLPASLELDDTLGAERFFVVYGDDPDEDVADVERAAVKAAEDLGARVKAGADLATVDALDVGGRAQASIHILKVR